MIEPIIQVIAAPQSGNSLRDKIPNEDSLDYEFSDTTLFQLNRFGGYARSDGGLRVNAALRAEWNFLGGERLEGLIGASYQQHIDENLYPQFQPWNGFERGDHLSDIVGRISFVPNKWVDFTARARADHDNGDIKMVDAITGFGRPIAHFNLGYFYGATNPYTLYLQNFNLPGRPYAESIQPLRDIIFHTTAGSHRRRLHTIRWLQVQRQRAPGCPNRSARLRGRRTRSGKMNA